MENFSFQTGASFSSNYLCWNCGDTVKNEDDQEIWGDYQYGRAHGSCAQLIDATLALALPRLQSALPDVDLLEDARKALITAGARKYPSPLYQYPFYKVRDEMQKIAAEAAKIISDKISEAPATAPSPSSEVDSFTTEPTTTYPHSDAKERTRFQKLETQDDEGIQLSPEDKAFAVISDLLNDFLQEQLEPGAVPVPYCTINEVIYDFYRQCKDKSPNDRVRALLNDIHEDSSDWNLILLGRQMKNIGKKKYIEVDRIALIPYQYTIEKAQEFWNKEEDSQVGERVVISFDCTKDKSYQIVLARVWM